MPVEDAAGVDAAFEHVRQQLLDVGAGRRGAAADGDVVEERLDGVGTPRAAAGRRGRRRRRGGRCRAPSTVDCVVADALEHRVRAQAAGQLATRSTASSPRSLTMSVAPNSRAERDPVRVAAEEDDLLGAEPLARRSRRRARRRRRRRPPRSCPGRPRRERGVVAGPHHVAEGQERRHQRASSPTGSTTSVPSACGTRTASPWPPSTPLRPEAAVEARGVQPFAAEDARAVRP